MQLADTNFEVFRKEEIRSAQQKDSDGSSDTGDYGKGKFYLPPIHPAAPPPPPSFSCAGIKRDGAPCTAAKKGPNITCPTCSMAFCSHSCREKNHACE